MIEPVADAGEDENPRRAELERGVEGELEVGGVLRGRMALDSRAAGLGGGHAALRCGIEVADCERDVEPEGVRMVDSTVGGDDGCAARHRARGLPSRSLAPRHHHD